MQPRRPQQKKSVPQRGGGSSSARPVSNNNPPNTQQLSHRVGMGASGLPPTSPRRTNSNSREAMGGASPEGGAGAGAGGARQSVGGASRTSMGVLMGNTRNRRSRSAGADGQRGVVRRTDLFLNEHQQRTEISNRFEADREVLLTLFVKGSAKAKDTAILRLDNTVSDLTKEMELNLFNNQRDLANIGRCLGSLYEDCLTMGLTTIDSFSRCVSDEEPAVYANRIAQLKLSTKKPRTVSSQHFVMPPPSPTSEARILYSNALAVLSSPTTSIAPPLPDVQQSQRGSARITPPVTSSTSPVSPQYNQGDLPSSSTSHMPRTVSVASLSTTSNAAIASGGGAGGYKFPSPSQQQAALSPSGVEVTLMSASATLPHGSPASPPPIYEQQHQRPSSQNRGGSSSSSPAGGKKYSVTFSATSGGTTQPSTTTEEFTTTTPGINSIKSDLLDDGGGGVGRRASFSSPTDISGAGGDVGAFASSVEKCPTCHQIWGGVNATNNNHYNIDNQTLPPNSLPSIRPAVATPDGTDGVDPHLTTSPPPPHNPEEDADSLSATLVDLMERCGVSGSYVDFSAAPHAEVTAYNIEGFVKDLSNSLQHLLHVVAGKLRYSDTRMAHLERVLDDKQTQLIATERMLHSYLIRAPSDLNRSIDMVRALGEEVQERLFTMENKLLATMEDLLTGNTALLLYEDKGPNVDPKAITGGGPGDTSHKRSTAVHTASSTVVIPKVSLPGIDASLGGAGAGTRGTSLAATRLRIPEGEDQNAASATTSSQKNNMMTHILGLNSEDVDSNGKTREERLEAHKASLVSHFKAQVAGIRSSQADLLQDLRDEILSLQKTRISTDITRGVSSPHTDESIKFCLTEPNAVQDSYKFLLTRHGQFVPNPGSSSSSALGTDATTSPAAYFHSGRHIGSLESTSRHERAVQDEAYAKAQACFAQGGTSHPLLRTNIPAHYRKRLEEDDNLYDRTQLLRLLDLVSHEPRVSEAITCVMAEYESWEAANPGEVAKRIATGGGGQKSTATASSTTNNNSAAAPPPIAAIEPRSIAAQQKRQVRREAGMQLEGKQRSLETVGLAAPPSLLERILSTGTNLQEETKEEQYAEQYDRYLLTIGSGGSKGRSTTSGTAAVHQPLMIGNAKVSLASRKEIMAAYDDNEAARIVARQAEELERSRQHHESRLTFQREVNSRPLDPLVPSDTAAYSSSSISGGGNNSGTNSASVKKYPARNSEYTQHYVLDNIYSKAHQLPSKTQVKTQQVNTTKRNDLGLQKLLEEIPQNPILDPVFSSSSEGGGGMIDVASSRQPLLLATPAARQWHTASVIHGDNMKALEDAVRRSGNSNADYLLEQNDVDGNSNMMMLTSSSTGGGGALVTTTTNNSNNGEKTPVASPVDFNTLPSLNGTKPFHSRRRLSGTNSLSLGAAMPDLPSLPGSSGIASDALAFRNPDGTKFTDAEIIKRHLSGEKPPPPRCAMPVSTAMKNILLNGSGGGGEVSVSGRTSPSSARRPGSSRAANNNNSAAAHQPPQNERYLQYMAQLGGSPVIGASPSSTTDVSGTQPPRPTTADTSLTNTLQERRPLYSGYAGVGRDQATPSQQQHPSRLTYPPMTAALDAGSAYTSRWESADPSAAYALPTQETTIATKRLLERQRQLLSELKS